MNDAGKKQVSSDNALFADAANTFWNTTEEDFYRYIDQLSRSQPDTTTWRDTLFAWGQCLLAAVNQLYDTFAWNDGFPPERMEQRVAAQGRLNAFTIKDLRNRAMYPPKEEK